MEIVEICPQHLYQFWCDDDLLTLVKDLLSDPELEWKPTKVREGVNIHPNGKANRRCFMSRDRNLHKLERFQPLVKWLDECVEEVRVKHKYNCDKISLTRLWGTRSRQNSDFYAHNHPFSLLSGVLYVTDSPAKTWFSERSMWEEVKFVNNSTMGLHTLPTIRDNNTDSISKVASEKGKLVMFPSSLLHSVDAHVDSDEPRYTMSFNSFPSGDIGGGDASTAGLRVQVL